MVRCPVLMMMAVASFATADPKPVVRSPLMRLFANLLTHSNGGQTERGVECSCGRPGAARSLVSPRIGPTAGRSAWCFGRT